MSLPGDTIANVNAPGSKHLREHAAPPLGAHYRL
jgi:hypothetical protein